MSNKVLGVEIATNTYVKPRVVKIADMDTECVGRTTLSLTYSESSQPYEPLTYCNEFIIHTNNIKNLYINSINNIEPEIEISNSKINTEPTELEKFITNQHISCYDDSEWLKQPNIVKRIHNLVDDIRQVIFDNLITGNRTSYIIEFAW